MVACSAQEIGRSIASRFSTSVLTYTTFSPSSSVIVLVIGLLSQRQPGIQLQRRRAGLRGLLNGFELLFACLAMEGPASRLFFIGRRTESIQA